MNPNDIEAIQSRLTLYGFAVDSLRWDLFDQIFATDGLHVRHGDGNPWTDLATFKRDFADYHKVFDTTRHSMTNFIIDIDGDVARTITYGDWLLVRFGAEGGDTWRGMGWYEDELVRTAAGWRIRRRQSRQVWREGNNQIGSTNGTRFTHKTSSLQHSDHAQAIAPLQG